MDGAMGGEGDMDMQMPNSWIVGGPPCIRFQTWMSLAWHDMGHRCTVLSEASQLPPECERLPRHRCEGYLQLPRRGPPSPFCVEKGGQG